MASLPSSGLAESGGTLTVWLNERSRTVPAGITLFGLRDRYKPDADLVVHNGFPASGDCSLAEGDQVVLIRKGEIPSAEEMDALLSARNGPGVLARIKGARIGVAGCGGLGSALAGLLVRTGVGNLVLVDFDLVEPSNLNRQHFFLDQIGAPKSTALAANLRRMNPGVVLETRQERIVPGTVASLFAGCDVVAECLDRADQKAMLLGALRSCLPTIPVVGVSGIAGVGPASSIRVRRAFGSVYLVGDGVSAAGPGMGLLAPRVAVAAGHQANLILRLLLGENLDQDLEEEK